MRLTYQDGFFYFKSDFMSRYIPKEAGFRWSQDKKLWFTQKPEVAFRLRDYGDEVVKLKLTQSSVIVTPWTEPLRESLAYGFQKEAVEFCLSRNNAYLAMDPGLGKTLTSIEVILNDPGPTLVVCPPFARYVWARELDKWAPDLSYTLVDPKKDFPIDVDVIIIGDSIINRDLILTKLKKQKFKRIIVDEAHRFKTVRSIRTDALLGSPRSKKTPLIDLAEKRILLSGTPMPNRPMELFPILSRLSADAINFMDEFEFGLKYCGGHQTEWGWDFRGFSNIDELRRKSREKFMLRIKKEDVLKELPPKTEQIVLLEGDFTKNFYKMDREILQDFDLTSFMDDPSQPILGQIATHRHDLGALKSKLVVQYVEEILELNEPIILFCHHKIVAKILFDMLKTFEPLLVTGDTPSDKKIELVERFQKGESNLIIGNIQALGTSFTITRAKRVIMAEYSWVPSDNDQATDRAHRIGQKDNVLVQYLVLKDTMDEYVLNAVLNKKKIINRVMG